MVANENDPCGAGGVAGGGGDAGAGGGPVSGSAGGIGGRSAGYGGQGGSAGRGAGGPAGGANGAAGAGGAMCTPLPLDASDAGVIGCPDNVTQYLDPYGCRPLDSACQCVETHTCACVLQHHFRFDTRCPSKDVVCAQQGPAITVTFINLCEP